MMTLWWAPNKTERMPFSVIMSWLRVMCTWLRWRKSPSWKKRSLGFHFGLGVTLIHHMVPSKDILPSNLTLWGRPRRRKRRNSSSFLLFLSIILSFLSLFWKPPPREKWIIGAAFLTSVWFLKRRKHSATSSQNLQSKPPVKTSSQQITTELLEEGGGPWRGSNENTYERLCLPVETHERAKERRRDRERKNEWMHKFTQECNRFVPTSNHFWLEHRMFHPFPFSPFWNLSISFDSLSNLMNFSWIAVRNARK